jgi:hypothetical protein
MSGCHRDFAPGRLAEFRASCRRLCDVVANQRACVNHRRIVRSEGTIAGPSRYVRRSSEITWAGASPAANRRSASRRSTGQEYEPGRSRVSVAASTRRRCAASASLLRTVNIPDANHTDARRSTNSRPERRRMNTSLRCA